ncbi:hypothetical protein B0H19DRAFT_1262319 [Mycena capillaripes]|nr:hypothetical protein B0H19DRAFT_1262319 [Mycena capillaripes]
MEAVLHLEKSGELSLFAVKRLWGLETCSVIDPSELKLGFPADPNYLPASAVKELLSKHGCIKLIEPCTSYETLIKRQLRHIVLAGTSVLHSYSRLARSGAQKDYDTVCRLAKQPFRISLTESRYLEIEGTRALLLSLIVFVLFVLTKNIDFHLVLRLGEVVAASAYRTFGVWGWAGIAALFFVIAPGEYAKLMELGSNTKVMLVLSG